MQDLSIIIPFGSSEKAGQNLLDQLMKAFPTAEIYLIGCDPHSPLKGGIYKQAPVKGRAAQLNFGASIASRKWIWFLHADSYLMELNSSYLENKKAHAINYLDLVFDGPWAMKINSLFVRFRSELFGMPFGDQGFLMTKSLWESLEKYPIGLSYGEDHAFIWESRCQGVPLNRLRRKVQTSSRKYRQKGWGKMTLIHLYLTYKQALGYLPRFMQGYPYLPRN